MFLIYYNHVNKKKKCLMSPTIFRTKFIIQCSDIKYSHCYQLYYQSIYKPDISLYKEKISLLCIGDQNLNH